MSDLERVSGLARKAAMLEGKVMAVFRRSDGTYGFCSVGECGVVDVVEYRHYL
jgi:hypothetical protein